MERLQPQLETALTSKSEALAAIAEIRQRIAVMGANDSEFWSLDQISKKIDSDELAPDDAVHEARALLGVKQDYH